MAIPKSVRIQVYNKCNGRCAYCGKELNGKFQVDHIKPTFRGWTDEEMARHKIGERGTDDIDNLLPACARCNKWKATWSIEQFRNEISLQIQRLNAFSSNYRMALDFGLIQENKTEVKFYFETLLT